MKGVKVIIGIGGLEDSEDEKWAEMTANQEKRHIFVESALKFLNRWNFDGLQIAWQYPVCKQVNCVDKLTPGNNFILEILIPNVLIFYLLDTVHRLRYLRKG